MEKRDGLAIPVNPNWFRKYARFTYLEGKREDIPVKIHMVKRVKYTSTYHEGMYQYCRTVAWQGLRAYRTATIKFYEVSTRTYKDFTVGGILLKDLQDRLERADLRAGSPIRLLIKEHNRKTHVKDETHYTVEDFTIDGCGSWREHILEKYKDYESYKKHIKVIGVNDMYGTSGYLEYTTSVIGIGVIDVAELEYKNGRFK